MTALVFWCFLVKWRCTNYFGRCGTCRAIPLPSWIAREAGQLEERKRQLPRRKATGPYPGTLDLLPPSPPLQCLSYAVSWFLWADLLSCIASLPTGPLGRTNHGGSKLASAILSMNCWAPPSQGFWSATAAFRGKVLPLWGPWSRDRKGWALLPTSAVCRPNAPPRLAGGSRLHAAL
jgi:hypothetical protein